MFARTIQICSAFLLACGLTASSPAVTLGDTDGVVRVRSAYPIGETIERLKKDIADKGIKFFGEIDQSKLAAEAGIKLQPSVLLIFGNPPLGTQFITASANAGLDWPVRLLVFENEKGEVWTAYTDFDWIARNREPQRSIQDGFDCNCIDHVEREGRITSCSQAGLPPPPPRPPLFLRTVRPPNRASILPSPSAAATTQISARPSLH